jgi:hypothetical protein
LLGCFGYCRAVKPLLREALKMKSLGGLGCGVPWLLCEQLNRTGGGGVAETGLAA